jgi:hypothetical protein
MNLENKFKQFLKSVDLKDYREKYRPIKIVEMDMPKQIQAISLLYEVYWNKKRFISFEDFYEIYLGSLKREIEEFRKKITMCEKCFYRGLPARIYRTWASIITQIHAGYVAELVFGPNSVDMSAELDHKGADFQVKYKNNIFNYQVKKETHSREVRREKISKNPIDGEFIGINYDVPSDDYFENPKKKNGEYKSPYLRFKNNKGLERLSNGFVVFTPHIFEQKKKELDKKLK